MQRRWSKPVDNYDANGLKTLATSHSLAARPCRRAGLDLDARAGRHRPQPRRVRRRGRPAQNPHDPLRRQRRRPPDLAQGGGLNASPQEIVAALRELIAGG